MRIIAPPKKNRKCSVCGKMLPTEEIITVNGKNYCPICGK
uniref:LysW biosynthesis protein LysW n=1 Tax=Siphoviridae sp. ctLqe90 TaxID=2825456 RepID=A0A8S5Q3V8_9CAUD|nr:MAG TPA: LysW biosynthesis protein LysW [Siphoviridae sp. ctLqe90]